MTDKPQSKADALRAMREASYSAKNLGPARATTGGDITRSSGGQFPGGPPSSDGDDRTRQAKPGRDRPSDAGMAPSPSEAKLKVGRPRKGEVRAKLWLDCDPPLSRSTWYRRQKEQTK